MNIKTYLDKTNTIIYNSNVNTGNNPVCELYYGDGFTRVLLYFDTTKIQALVTDKTYSDITKLKHVLKFKNCWGLQSNDSKLIFNSGKNTTKERTSSFDLELVRMPETWDSGLGNDFTKDGFMTKNASYSENGSNWYVSRNEYPWVNGDGVFSGNTSGVTIQTQHFDIGDEDIEMDITNEVNSIISGSTNYGYMLKFPSLLENTQTDTTQYCGFFAQPTSTFFKPYLETTYDYIIQDDRNNFYLDKDNKLYFYSVIGGKLSNLDSLPTCTIDGVAKTVIQATKGVYYVNINLPSTLTNANTMLFDVWSDITYNGVTFPDVELEFVTKQCTDFFNFNNETNNETRFVPYTHGVKLGSKVDRGQVIKLHIQTREEFTKNKMGEIELVEWRLYVKESDKILTVWDFTPVNKTFNDGYVFIDTDSLLPNKYFVDVKVSKNDEVLIYNEKLHFEIVNKLS